MNLFGIYFLKMINFVFLFFPLFILPEPIFSHGTNTNCKDECDSYYCPAKVVEEEREEE